MRKKFAFFLAGTIVLMTACNNPAPNTSNAVVKTKADTLLDEVNDGHNIGMAKMGQLTRTQQETNRLLDSINRLPSKLQAPAASYKSGLKRLLLELNYAESAMDRWMSEFKWDSTFASDDNKISYLEAEKEKVTKVKEAILGSLHKADSLLKKKL